MTNKNGPVIDMTADGQFVERPKPSFLQIALRVVSFVAALCVGAVLVWTAFIMIPILLVLGLVGYMLVRSQRRGWRPF